MVRFPQKARDIFLKSVQTSSGAYPLWGLLPRG